MGPLPHTQAIHQLFRKTAHGSSIVFLSSKQDRCSSPQFIPQASVKQKLFVQIQAFSNRAVQDFCKSIKVLN
jgi:hypothetical protein